MEYDFGVVHREEIIKAIMEAGAAVVGVAPAVNLPDVERFMKKQQLSGNLAKMSWLGKTAHKRTHPRNLLDDARSIICSAWLYSQKKSNKHFARYALSVDYHGFIIEELKRAWGAVASGYRAVFSVDAEPVAEKPYSEMAGLGWIGRNSILINSEFGSFFCIGIIITDLDIEPDKSQKNMCGDCTKCMDACPTGAINRNGGVDCRRCISYLTIEEKGEIPEELRTYIGETVFGCDICQEACPYNNPVNKRVSAVPARKIDICHLGEFIHMSDSEFRDKFNGTPVARIGRERFLRNVAVALGNFRDGNSIEFLRHGLHDPDSLVRIHSRWAMDNFDTVESCHERGL